ncbi:MAG: protein kinase [Sandaracinaceae bacterium]
MSPSNILVGYDGSCRLTDFGIAKAVIGHDKTSTGILKGKLGYLAPEQLQFHDASVASDVYSLGVSMFEALAGRRLFRADTPARTARSILEDPPPDLYDIREDVHPALEELVLHMLAKHPSDRPGSAAEVAARLESMKDELRRESADVPLRDLLITHFGEAAATEELLTATTQKVVHKRTSAAWALAVLMGGAGLSGAAWWVQSSDTRPSTPPAAAQRPAAPVAVSTAPADSGTNDAGSLETEATLVQVPSEVPPPTRRSERVRRRPPPTEERAAEPPAATEPDDGLWGWRQ